jgi:8-oxo-dGTP pyrophosphatase MutT (NUDIX family)
MLTFRRDKYYGVLVTSDNLPESSEEFEILLQKSILEWENQAIKVVWLQVSSHQADLIKIAIAKGFEFHHCLGSKLTLTKRLISNSHIPLPCTHTIGAGGVVLTDDRKVLVVLERQDLIERPGYYKLPGGMLERGEHFSLGVVREVYEETGVETEFQGLLSLRHHHKGQFGSSNIYMVCLLKPLTYEISIDEVEIGKAMWVSADEYLSNSEVGIYNKHVVETALNYKFMKSVKLDSYMSSPNDYEVYLPEF